MAIAIKPPFKPLFLEIILSWKLRTKATQKKESRNNSKANNLKMLTQIFHMARLIGKIKNCFVYTVRYFHINTKFSLKICLYFKMCLLFGGLRAASIFYYINIDLKSKIRNKIDI